MNQETRDEVVQLFLDDIIPNRFQPREVFDEKALKELAVSIKEHGVIQPIIVRNMNGKYEIIAGERRYKASALAGLTKIPAIIRDLDDKESSKVALLENLQRRNLNPIEEARTYQKILELDDMTQEQLAKTMGKSQSAVANKLRLLSLPIEIQDALLQEKISERHARTLLSIEDSKQQQEMLNKIIKEKMTVKALEESIKNMNNNETKGDETMMNNNEEKNNVPNIGTNFEEKPQFINYGEINEDDEIEENNLFNNDSNSIQNVDINEMKEVANDIIPSNNDNNNTSDLDNLLNINQIKQQQTENTTQEEKYKFITPAEEIVKNDEQEQVPNIQDYFNKPDIIPNINNAIENNNENESQPEETTINNTETAIEAVRNTVNNIKNNNIKVEIDEMDFNDSYQIIIKIDK